MREAERPARAVTTTATDGAEAAEELVSRSGDRWSAAYTAREYEGLRQTLDGEYVGVGISVRRERDAQGAPSVAVARVQPGSPGGTGRHPRRATGCAPSTARTWTDQPVTDVVARLRGSGPASPRTPAPLGSSVDLALDRGGKRWKEKLHAPG